jgi:hypothetical protein
MIHRIQVLNRSSHATLASIHEVLHRDLRFQKYEHDDMHIYIYLYMKNMNMITSIYIYIYMIKQIDDDIISYKKEVVICKIVLETVQAHHSKLLLHTLQRDADAKVNNNMHVYTCNDLSLYGVCVQRCKFN